MNPSDVIRSVHSFRNGFVMTRRPIGLLRQSLLGTAVAGLIFWPAVPALGNPSGATVVHGTVDFQNIGNELTVTNSPGAIIDWQAFSIAQDEITRFQQEAANSAVLNRVAGVVTESGGLLSHAAVICREYGIPAVLAIKDATARIPDGQRIIIDGGQGVVELVD